MTCNITNIIEASEKIQDMRLNNAVIEEKLKNILTGDGFESVANKISQL